MPEMRTYVVRRVIESVISTTSYDEALQKTEIVLPKADNPYGPVPRIVEVDMKVNPR